MNNNTFPPPRSFMEKFPIPKCIRFNSNEKTHNIYNFLWYCQHVSIKLLLYSSNIIHRTLKPQINYLKVVTCTYSMQILTMCIPLNETILGIPFHAKLALLPQFSSTSSLPIPLINTIIFLSKVQSKLFDQTLPLESFLCCSIERIMPHIVQYQIKLNQFGRVRKNQYIASNMYFARDITSTEKTLHSKLH